MKPLSVALAPVILGLSGCNLLEADVRTLDPASEFVDPEVDPDTRDLEDDPSFDDTVARFIRDVPYLQGYVNGRQVWYWSVPEETPTFIAPVYRIVDPTGQPIGRPIIDVIPTKPGYTPWWRVFEVRTTAAYRGERLWSRAAIDLAVQRGLVEPPEATTRVLDCPVVHRDSRVAVGGGQFVTPTTVWYRDHRAHWLEFSASLELPVEIDGRPIRRMPRFPVHVFRRINEAHPLYEARTGIDINGDARLDASNNVFSGGPGDARYSPLWFVSEVRTVAGFHSIDRPPFTETDLSAETQFFDPVLEQVTSPSVVSLTLNHENLVNCPLQRIGGGL